MSKPENPAAFPLAWTEHHVSVENGMWLRDWFAGQALAMRFGPRGSTASLADMAAYAYQMADAMLAERAKQEGK
jgi:hypothetical protein